MNYKPFICMMTNSTCYKNTCKMTVKGVLWHSTGADNPWLKRYVQPTEDNPNRQAILDKLGVNKNRNDWNHIEKQAGLNAWIGKFADGSVGTVQAMPWDYRPWGCGTRYKNGYSCNDHWIQFEICEDDLHDKAYAQAVWGEAVRFTAYICEMYGLDPMGTVPFHGKDVPVILDHKTSWEYGFGSGHGDIRHWFPKILGKDMADARKEVRAIIDGDKPQPVPPVPTGYPDPPFKVTCLKSGITGRRADHWSSSKYLGTLDKGTYTIISVSGDFGRLKEAPGWIYLVDDNLVIERSLDGYTVGKKYKVVPSDGLNLRTEPSTDAKVIKLMPKGTIVLCRGLKVVDGNTWMQIVDSEGWCAAHYNGDRYVK